MGIFETSVFGSLTRAGFTCVCVWVCFMGEMMQERRDIAGFGRWVVLMEYAISMV